MKTISTLRFILPALLCCALIATTVVMLPSCSKEEPINPIPPTPDPTPDPPVPPTPVAKYDSTPAIKAPVTDIQYTTEGQYGKYGFYVAGMDRQFTQNIIQNEANIMCATLFPTTESIFKGEMRFALFDKAGVLRDAFDPRPVTIEYWGTYEHPRGTMLPPGEYYLRVLLRADGDHVWSVTPHYEGYNQGWICSDTADWRRYVLPPDTRFPSVDYIGDYKKGFGGITSYPYNERVQMPYEVYNRLNEPIKGTIKATHEYRTFMDTPDSAWVYQAGQIDIIIQPKSYYKGIMDITLSRIAGSYVSSIHFYWQEKGSDEWILLPTNASRCMIPLEQEYSRMRTTKNHHYVAKPN